MDEQQTDTSVNSRMDASQGFDGPSSDPRAKWKRIVFRAISIVVGLATLAFLFVWISLSGGISGAISNLKSEPDPDSRSIVAKREGAVDAINASFGELDNIVSLNNYASSTHDRCYRGQNNFKVNDGYAYRCTYRITKFYGFNGDFRQRMIDYEQNLRSIDWWSRSKGGYPILAIMEQYYDKHYGTDKSLPRNFPDGYFVSSLPTPIGGYIRNEQILELEYAERATKNLFQVEYAQNISRDTLSGVFDKQNFQDIDLLFEGITSDYNFVLVVSIQQNYFEN